LRGARDELEVVGEDGQEMSRIRAWFDNDHVLSGARWLKPGQRGEMQPH
jgi:hypothetical protein